MSWNDFYRRRDIMAAVLRAASRDPVGPLPFAGIPGAQDTFGSEENLLLALHHKWTLLLSGHLEAQLLDDTDHVAALTRAWQAAVAANPVLRVVLDANLDRYPALRAAREAQQRMLALSAGFADPSEPTATITKVGAALEALLREGRDVRNPVAKPAPTLAPSR